MAPVQTVSQRGACKDGIDFLSLGFEVDVMASLGLEGCYGDEEEELTYVTSF